jgi:hypothetical protein
MQLLQEALVLLLLLLLLLPPLQRLCTCQVLAARVCWPTLLLLLLLVYLSLLIPILLQGRLVLKRERPSIGIEVSACCVQLVHRLAAVQLLVMYAL